MYSFRNIKERVDVDQIDLAPEILEQRGHDQLVVAPDEPVAEIIMHGGPQFAKSCLTGCQGLAPGLSTVSIFCMGIAAPATSTLRRRPYSSYFPSQTSSVLIWERG